MKKTIGILVCTLLISVAVAPSINAINIQKNEVNEVREQAKTLNLQDTDSLEKIINDLIKRFHDAETQEEKTTIFKKILAVLDDYGLLSGLSPEDLTVEEVQKLIVNGHLNSISSNNLYSTDQENNIIRSDESISFGQQVSQGNNGGLVDNIKIRCLNLVPLNILFALVWFPVYYLELRISNNNDVPVFINQHYKLTTKDDKVLYEFDHNLPFKLNSHYTSIDNLFTRYFWRDFDYMWGKFNLIYTLSIPDDGSSKTVVFEGFVYNIGAYIFNKEGEVIDGSDGQNIQSNPTGQQSTTPSSQIDTIGFAEMPSDNNPPEAPTIDGPGEGRPGVEYYWDFMAVDPEEDDVSYEIDWGDGTYEDWIGPYSSGEPVEVGHTYNEYCEVTIRARAKDIYDAVGDWSEFDIEVSKSSQQSSNPLFLQTLQQLINAR